MLNYFIEIIKYTVINLPIKYLHIIYIFIKLDILYIYIL